MNLKFSNFPWEMKVEKEGDMLIINKMDQSLYADLLTNNENFSGNMPEDEKETLKLCIESTNVNKFFKNH